MKIIKEFEKIGKLPYDKRILKHEPTPSYFHLVRQLAECMMRSNELNWHVHGSYAEKTAPSSNVNVTNKRESKRSTVNEPLSQKCSAKENKLCSTKNDESEFANKKQKDAKNEVGF